MTSINILMADKNKNKKCSENTHPGNSFVILFLAAPSGTPVEVLSLLSTEVLPSSSFSSPPIRAPPCPPPLPPPCPLPPRVLFLSLPLFLIFSARSKKFWIFLEQSSSVTKPGLFMLCWKNNGNSFLLFVCFV